MGKHWAHGADSWTNPAAAEFCAKPLKEISVLPNWGTDAVTPGRRRALQEKRHSGEAEAALHSACLVVGSTKHDSPWHLIFILSVPNHLTTAAARNSCCFSSLDSPTSIKALTLLNTTNAEGFSMSSAGNASFPKPRVLPVSLP